MNRRPLARRSIALRMSARPHERSTDKRRKLEDVVKAMRRSGAQLEGHQDWVAYLVELGAAELSLLATTLRTNDLQGLLGDLASLARRQPALFVDASMVAGFALTRVGRLAVSTLGFATTRPPCRRSFPQAKRVVRWG